MNLSILINDADQLQFQGNFSEAISKYTEILVDNERYLLDPDLAKLNFNLGNCYLKIKDYKTSINFFTSALDTYNRLKESREIANVCVHLGVAYSRTNDSQLAVQYFLEAGDNFLKIAEENFTNLIYTNANQFFSYAHRMYDFAKRLDVARYCLNKSVNSQILFFKDLIISSNMFYYTNNFKDAQKYSWKALNYSLDIISFGIKNDVNLSEIAYEIKSLFTISHRILSDDKIDSTGTIENKLRNLTHFFDTIISKSIDLPEIESELETQKNILQSLFPISPPSFMFLSKDGRLMYHTKAIEGFNPSMAEDIGNTLFAGILTALRAAFLENPFPASGLINEIDLGGHTLLLENEESLIGIAIVSISFPEIRTFIKTLTKELNSSFGNLIRNWKGDSDSLTNLINLVNQRITAKFIDN